MSLLSILTIYSFGQDRKFSFGFNGGTNLSIPYEKEFNPFPEATNYDRVRTNKPNFGYFAEVQAHYQFSEKIFTKWTIGYQFTQNKYEYGPDGFIETGNFKMSGLYNSLGVDYLFTSTNIYLGAGVCHKYILKAEEKGKIEGDWITPSMLNDPNDPVINDPLLPKSDILVDLTNDISRNEMGFLVEAGKIFKLGDKIKLNSFLRYNQSMVQILPDKFNMKHYSMYLSLGVGIVY